MVLLGRPPPEKGQRNRTPGLLYSSLTRFSVYLFSHQLTTHLPLPSPSYQVALGIPAYQFSLQCTLFTVCLSIPRTLKALPYLRAFTCTLPAVRILLVFHGGTNLTCPTSAYKYMIREIDGACKNSIKTTSVAGHMNKLIVIMYINVCIVFEKLSTVCLCICSFCIFWLYHARIERI